MSGPLLVAERLTVRLPDGTPVVDGATLRVHPGECVALVGESGSGKSLTLRALIGLLPPGLRADAARHDIVSPGDRAAPAPGPGSRQWTRIRGAHAALVPQDALGSLDPLRRVEDEVGDALRLHGLASGARRRALVIAALRQAGVPEAERRLRERSEELSGGIRQRTLLAAALVAEPRLILADEPTSALDAGHRGRLLAELRRRTAGGAGVLLVTHDLASVRDVADRVLVMSAGRIVEEGARETVFLTPQHPETVRLLAAELVPRPPAAREKACREPGQTPAVTTVARPAHPALELTGVTASRGRGRHARRVLRNASLTVFPGETVGLIGESGSGKTTLLRVALGLLAPEQGTVRVNGIPRAGGGRAASRALRGRVGLVPQDPLASFPPGSRGAWILVDALRAAGVDRGARASRALALAAEVGLPDEALDRPASTLSGGQRQRLAIARALAGDPAILLLDEPVSALDATVRARILALLDRVQAQRGTALLLVSHDLEVIRHLSHRVLELRAGTLEPEGSPDPAR